MAQRPTTRRVNLLLGVDLLLANAALVLGVATKHALDPGVVWNEAYFVLLLVVNITFWLAAQLTGLYPEVRRLESRRQFWKLAEFIALHLLLVASFVFIRKAYYYSRLALFFTYGYWVIGLVVWRLAYHRWRLAYHRRQLGLSRVVIVGYGEPVQRLLGYLRDHPELGAQVVGFFTHRHDVPLTELPNRLGTPDEVAAYLHQHPVDEIYAFAAELTEAQSEQLLALAERYLIPLNVVPDFKAFGLSHLHLQYYDELPVLALRPHPLADTLNKALKRAFDLAFASLFFLLIGWWLLPLVAVLVRLGSPGPAFFVQLRAGRGGRPFRCYKFRTMRTHNGPFAQATPGDSRVTPIGRLLRKTNLDELPQFWNVLLGDMSVVGPRPHPLELDAQYAPYLEQYKVRNVVKPGVTGLAQTRGHRGATPDVRTMQHRVRMDVFYVANWSLRLDLQIILQTVLLALRGDKQAY